MCVLPACLYSEAGVVLSMERAGVTMEMMGLPLPGDGTGTNSQENYSIHRSDVGQVPSIEQDIQFGNT